MKKTVGYSKTFIVGGEWEKIWSEEELPEDTSHEGKRKKWYELRNEVHSFHYESNKAAEKQKEIQVTEEPQTFMSMEDQINSCTDIKILESYRLIIKGVPSLIKLYDKKRAELKISS